MSNVERNFAGCSRDVYHRNGDEDLEPFCTHDNWQSAVIFLNQELELNALPSICNNDQGGRGQLDVVSLVNVNWSLIQSHKEKLKKIDDLEHQLRRFASDIEHMNTNVQKLRDLIEYKERQANDSESKERQAVLMNQQLQNELRMAKDEVKKFSSMLMHRETRYNHEARKKDQELAKLKERFLRVLTETKSYGQHGRQHASIEVIGDMVDKPSGKPRGRWKSDTEDQRRGDDLLQKVIVGNQSQQDLLANECDLLQQQMAQMLHDLANAVGQDLNADIAKLPSTCEAFQIEWKSLLDKVATNDQAPVSEGHVTAEALESHFNLETFVPLSDVKHIAPPGWVSRAQCTLPPTGKAETVKLRQLSTDGANSGEKPRPRSSHLSPYRGMQATRTHVPNIGRSKTGSRCGSLSPTSVSPTRNSAGDSRSLPRMIGSKLSLRRPVNSNSSANNSSADESSGPVSTYRKLVGKRRSLVTPSSASTSRPQSPPTARDSESESSNELAKQLKNLGKYLEKRDLKRKESEADHDILDSEMDEYLVNIRKALSKKT